MADRAEGEEVLRGEAVVRLISGFSSRSGLSIRSGLAKRRDEEDEPAGIAGGTGEGVCVGGIGVCGFEDGRDRLGVTRALVSGFAGDAAREDTEAEVLAADEMTEEGGCARIEGVRDMLID